METLAKLMPSKIEQYSTLEFIPRNDNPVAQSSIYLCSMCAQMMVARYATLLIGDAEMEVAQRLIMYVSTGESINMPILKEENCPFCQEKAQMSGQNTNAATASEQAQPATESTEVAQEAPAQSQ